MPHGTVGPVLLRLRQGEYTLLYAQSLLEELIDVLNRPRIRHKYNLSQADIKTIISLILLWGEAVELERTITACRDPTLRMLFRQRVTTWIT
jgi:predicted nucleic acid-binding protein